MGSVDGTLRFGSARPCDETDGLSHSRVLHGDGTAIGGGDPPAAYEVGLLQPAGGFDMVEHRNRLFVG